ncbi:3-keto-disaccharide hydrolase [Blastopirellula marina]|uniref:3-keto-alpha-glucoside-1,2-lyase/3-keto-2-hydroxy-glucal hydratase domain-containing protein n=1 Tax=Blastopirellula marina DSM 3645 TaxID=314230 RepID=A3ZYG0_9BACT|nr:DUF1080 domain-containing protein [Blastopirellula marina]EAQ78410.1 hypothetical protein DSM3645_06956 [Blastopirellula marina DSM 3645]
MAISKYLHKGVPMLARSQACVAALTAILLLTLNGAAGAEEQAWRSLFDGKTLGDWKSVNFGGEGEVSVSDGAILMAQGVNLTGATYQKAPPKTNYEIRFEAKRLEGIDFFAGLTFPVEDSFCSWIVGGWGGAVVGLSSIDGKDASQNETTKYMGFDDNRWYRFRLKVTPEKIAGWIDDKLVIDQNIKDRKITTRNEVTDSQPLGFSAWQSTAAIRKIEIRDVGKKAD